MRILRLEIIPCHENYGMFMADDFDTFIEPRNALKLHKRQNATCFNLNAR
jgi:hypothetical protein